MHHLLDATMVDMQTVARLIENFIPSSYDISLSINRADRVFEGIVTIHGRSISGTNNIILHSKDLDIISVAIDGKEAIDCNRYYVQILAMQNNIVSTRYRPTMYSNNAFKYTVSPID